MPAKLIPKPNFTKTDFLFAKTLIWYVNMLKTILMAATISKIWKTLEEDELIKWNSMKIGSTTLAINPNNIL